MTSHSRSLFGKVLVTGAAGFIGSTLVDRLLAEGHVVVGFDNYSTGMPRFLERAMTVPAFTMIQGDILDQATLRKAMAGCEFVFHLAANADIRFGVDDRRRDLEQNTRGTCCVLEAMQAEGVNAIAFASTGSVYGEARIVPTPEDAPFPVQTSFYAASKAAAEGFISAYSEAFGIRAWIFRFVSILGERYSHGHVFDFVRQLRQNPCRLRVLGDGTQRKSYLYVQDCVDAMVAAIGKSAGKLNIFNLGANEYCQVRDSVTWITEHLGVTPELEFTGGERGWVGDNPFIFLETSRIRSLGWRPTLSIREGIERTVDFLMQEPWVLDARV